jgi:hypothetical protein
MKYLNIVNSLIDKNIIKHNIQDVLVLAQQIGDLQSIYYCVKNSIDNNITDAQAYQTSDDDILAWLRLEFNQF